MHLTHERQSSEGLKPRSGLKSLTAWKWLVFLVIAMAATFGAQAQIAGTGAISGSVTDPSGARVAKATVTATAVDTNVNTVRTTTSDGDFNITPLSPGEYTLTVTAKGFEKLVQEKVTVNALETSAVNLKLSVGAEVDTVTVSDAPPVLNTADAILGGVMDNEMYSSLPLLMGAANQADQRRATDFANLMPGVQNTYQASSTSANPTDASGAVNGGSPGGGTSEIYIDGLNLPSSNGTGDPRLTWTVFGMDSVDQFQTQTVGYSSQYAGQGVQNYSIKQGGNSIHGSVYEYIRNTVLDAWQPSSKTPTPVGTIPVGGVCTSVALATSTSWCKLGGIKTVEIMNEYGIVLSGPIIKNKLFLFYNYGQYRYSGGAKPQVQTEPTLAMMGYGPTGASLGYADFSGYNAATNYSIYDPATQTVNNCANAACKRSIFAVNGVNNLIPAARISSAANYINKIMLPYESAVNQASYGNNATVGHGGGLSNWYQTGRLDYAPNSQHQLSLIVGFGRQSTTGAEAIGGANALPAPFNTNQAYAPQSAVDVLKDTWTINPHMVNQIALGYARYVSVSHTPNDKPEYSAAQTGLLGTPAGQASFFPGITFSGGVDAPTKEAGYSWNSRVGNTYTLMDSLQWDHGKHSVTIGGQVVYSQYNGISPLTYSSPMSYTFSSAQTQGYTSTGGALSNTGSAFASYMLGAVGSSSVTVASPEQGARWTDPSFWLQDNYKVTPKLTLNLGLRWDIWPAVHEVHNLISWLDPNGFNTTTGNHGTLAFAGGNPQDGYHTGKPIPSSIWMKNVAPRLGAAYALNSKTVIRTSYGLSFARGNFTGGSQSGSPSTTGLIPAASAATTPSNQPQFYWDGSACTNGVALDGFTPCGWTGSLATPQSQLPSGATLAEFGSVETVAGANLNSVTVNYWDPYYGSRTPEYINWSFGFERQITSDMSISASYVGSEGHFIKTSGAVGSRNGKLPESMAALAGYTLTGSSATTQTACSGATCLYPILGQKSTVANLALAQADGFTPSNAFSPIAAYYASNAVYGYYTAFPQYKAVSDITSFNGNENWNALEVSIRQRASHGLNWMLNYTYSKGIDDLGTYRVNDNNRLDRSVSAANQTHSLVATAVYRLPIGKGHTWGDNLAYRSIASNWAVSGIGTYHTGLPLLITGSGCGGNSILGTCMPSVVRGQKGRQYTYGKTAAGKAVSWDPLSANFIGNVQYVNPAAFTVNVGGTTSGLGAYGTYNGQAYSVGNGPALYVPGNAARTAPLNMYSQSTVNVDAAVKRTFSIYRDWKFQFEMDMTNVANHVVYAPPSNNTVQGGGNLTFGSITAVANNPRDIQFSGRISW